MKKAIRHWQLYLFLLLPVAYILVFAYQPMFGVQIAFRDFTPRAGIWGSEWVGLKHFNTFFQSHYFSRVIVNTLRISFYGIAVGFPITIVFALMLNMVKHPRFKKAVQLITYMPHFISVVVLVGMMMQFFNPIMGVYGTFYRMLGGEGYPPDLFSKSGAFIHMYIWSGVWQGTGWGTIIYLAALSATDASLDEAARIDGATRLQRVWHIDLPSILPTASILLILSTGGMMSVGFEKVFLMQNTGNLIQSEVISTYVYKTGLASAMNQTSYAAAIGLFNNVINFALLMIVNAIARRLGDEPGTHGLF